MAYDYSSIKILKTFDLKRDNSKSGRYYIQVKRLVDEKDSIEYLDIRNAYKNEDGEILPTAKGVRFNSEQAVDVAVALINCLSKEETDEFLDRIK